MTQPWPALVSDLSAMASSNPEAVELVICNSGQEGLKFLSDAPGLTTMSSNGTFAWVESQTQVASLGRVFFAGTGDTNAVVVATLIPAGLNTAFSVRRWGRFCSR